MGPAIDRSDAGPSDGPRSDRGVPVDSGVTEPLGDGGVDDQGLGDGGEVDASLPRDGGPDPARCPVGQADGCCPLAIVHGGTDPDCPDLACAPFSASADVELDPLGNEYAGGVGTAYTGEELVLVWADIRYNDFRFRYTFERRAVATGTITLGPTSLEAPTATFSPLLGITSLAIEPKTKALVWTAPSNIGSNFRAFYLAHDGAPIGEPIVIGRICNPFTVSLGSVWPLDGRPLVYGEGDDCEGESWARIARVEADGMVNTFRQDSDRAYGGFVAYDEPGRRLHVLYPLLSSAYNELHYSIFDLATETFSTPVIIPSPVGGTSFEMAHLATDGDGLLILGSISRFEMFVGIVYQTFVGRWDPTNGWGPVTVLRPFSAQRRLGEARILWTGSGYLAAATEVDGDGTSNGVTDRDAPRVELITLGPDGVVRDRQPLRPPEVETVFPNLTWAGDRIAVTWGERAATPQVGEQHKLRWLSCP